MPISNFFKIILLITSIQLTACASLSLESKYPTYEHKTDYNVLQEDKINGLGQTKTEDGQTTQVLLVGEKYNYLLTEGGLNLLNIMQKLPEQDRLILNKLPLELDVYNDNIFYGQIHFYHPVPVKQLTPAKKQELLILGFMEESLSINSETKQEFLSKNIAIKGTIYEGTKHASQLSLAGSIPIILREPRLTMQENKGNALKKKLLSPLALGLDIITLPIQLGAEKLSKK
ncbi:hypothetical protein ACEZKA_001173 [Acinetobacter baumannii]|uniref:hypothetical protein n=1 Tax=Acinetobacter baumannii TaxID=470 RepID=UPI000DE6ED84|nr:hypothetical protein [Acinetobacter baumannii]EKT9377891.1 hypothetical protein [Acinetobacter baumannii]EKU0756770.1 hypothetical protein [Acinetobacter baumannii]EKV8391411.1 hypothetical protein [Acinetobacter baumannii]EKW0729257.1 hypothetical protein [Acinetobacter baumannii]EKW0736307.1 hypothetical protein [Acinetobacter baumannii]